MITSSSCCLTHFYSLMNIWLVICSVQHFYFAGCNNLCSLQGTLRFQCGYLSTVREQRRLYRNRMIPWLLSSLNCNKERGVCQWCVRVNITDFLFSVQLLVLMFRGNVKMERFLDSLTHWMCSRMNCLTSSFLLNVNSCSWNTVTWFTVINPSSIWSHDQLLPSATFSVKLSSL